MCGWCVFELLLEVDRAGEPPKDSDPFADLDDGAGRVELFGAGCTEWLRVTRSSSISVERDSECRMLRL